MVVSVQRDLDGAKCPRCGGEVAFYDSPALQARHDPPQTPTCVFRWPLADGSYAQLPATRYYCPKCEQLAMTFAVVGCLD
jgi:ribosomal protein S27AE